MNSLHQRWQAAHKNYIVAKELVPIVISCAGWDPLLSHRSVLFRCYNNEVVAAIKRLSQRASSDAFIAHLNCDSLWCISIYPLILSIFM